MQRSQAEPLAPHAEVLLPDSQVSFAEQQPMHVAGVHFFCAGQAKPPMTPMTKATVKGSARIINLALEFVRQVSDTRFSGVVERDSEACCAEC